MRIENYREKGEREKREFRRGIGIVLAIFTFGIYLGVGNFSWPIALIFLIGLYLYENNKNSESTVHLITTFNTHEIFSEKILYEILDKYEKEKFKKSE